VAGSVAGTLGVAVAAVGARVEVAVGVAAVAAAVDVAATGVAVDIVAVAVEVGVSSGAGSVGAGVAVGVTVGVAAVAVGVGVAAAHAVAEMSLVSIVTAPFRARALPGAMLAPVWRVMSVSARILPAKVVLVPRVAELPICQNTLHPEPPLITTTDELLAVVSVLTVWKMKTAPALPPASSVSVCSSNIILRLKRDRIGCVYRSPGNGPWREARDRTTWTDAQISTDGGRARIGHRRATQDREARRRTQ
jgi:hypothetical protein